MFLPTPRVKGLPPKMPIDEAHAETVLLRKSPEKENDVTPDKVLAAIGLFDSTRKVLMPEV